MARIQDVPLPPVPSYTRCGETDEHPAHIGYLFTLGTEADTQTRILCDGRGSQAARQAPTTPTP